MQTGFLHGADRGDTVVVLVRAADVAVEAAAGVEVVIHPPDAGLLQFASRVFPEQAERDAEFEIGKLGLDGARRFGETTHVGRARPASARHHAVPARSGSDGAARAFLQFGHGVEAVARDGRLGDRRLRAVVAVFRAQAAAGIAQLADLHSAAVMAFANEERRVQQVRQLCVRRRQHGACLAAVELVSGEDPVGDGGERRRGGVFGQHVFHDVEQLPVRAVARKRPGQSVTCARSGGKEE